MDLIQYYAKYGPKARSNGDASPTKSSTSDRDLGSDASPKKLSTSGANLKVPSLQAAPAVSARANYHFDAPEDSDVEEDDSKDVSSQELRELMNQLRTPTSNEMRPRIIQFNKTHHVECNLCTDLNAECRITATSTLCQLCATKKRRCFRTDVFYQWTIRHKFNLSWTKAEEVLQEGLLLMRTKKEPVSRGKDFVPKAEANESANVPVASTSMEVRTSPRTPVPRVRKEPASIVAPIKTPTLGRARSRAPKRALVSAPPRPDHKRRKVVAFETPELKAEPEPTSIPERGREILSAPQFERKRMSERLNKPLVITLPALNKSSEPETAVQEPPSSGSPDPHLSARVTETEKRLEAVEAQLRMAELGFVTRRRVVAELDGVIGALEGNSDVHVATDRLRALHSSLLEEEEDLFPANRSWDPSQELLLDDEPDKQLNSFEPEVHDSKDDENAIVNGDPILVDDDKVEPPIGEDSLTAVDAPMEAVTAT
ncbi:hypothetical protein MVEN_00424600 [Mycena venus]|uniref:Uncharacterized protein n=1 Tax=Mycena venus TaxID=2733690 RepID=A0A8H7D8R0_9AGAR|nr:hypothetical protein MVEN_00424600 [Mycena venus]